MLPPTSYLYTSYYSLRAQWCSFWYHMLFCSGHKLPTAPPPCNNLSSHGWLKTNKAKEPRDHETRPNPSKSAEGGEKEIDSTLGKGYPEFWPSTGSSPKVTWGTCLPSVSEWRRRQKFRLEKNEILQRTKDNNLSQRSFRQSKMKEN